MDEPGATRRGDVQRTRWLAPTGPSRSVGSDFNDYVATVEVKQCGPARFPTLTKLAAVDVAEGRQHTFDQHRSVLYMSVGTSRWQELVLQDDNSVTVQESPLTGLLYTIAGVEDSSLSGGDTVLSGVDGTEGRLTAILLKDGKPVARWRGPDRHLNGEFVQAGRELYVMTTTIDEESRAKTVHLHKPQREDLE